MEYLVAMTTLVPDGVPQSELADMRTREAAHTHLLALKGRVLRLWRPPLQRGEWRTIGLFVAENPNDLERTLASMPLRIWRTDDVTALRPHPNDPGPGRTELDASSTEFMTTFVVTVPAGAGSARIDSVRAQEAERAHELAREGRLIRLWRLPGHGRDLGLWQATDSGAMQGILHSLPMADWLTTDVVPLTRHPNDPATTSPGGAAGRHDPNRQTLP